MPDVLREMFDVSDIRGMSKAVLAGLGGDWLKYVLGGVIGATGTYMALSLLGYVNVAAKPQVAQLVGVLLGLC